MPHGVVRYHLWHSRFMPILWHSRSWERLQDGQFQHQMSSSLYLIIKCHVSSQVATCYFAEIDIDIQTKWMGIRMRQPSQRRWKKQKLSEKILKMWEKEGTKQERNTENRNWLRIRWRNWGKKKELSATDWKRGIISYGNYSDLIILTPFLCSLIVVPSYAFPGWGSSCHLMAWHYYCIAIARALWEMRRFP